MRSLVLHRYRDWTVMEQNHLSAAEIAAFIDQTLEGEFRVRAVEHLGTCERCRDEVAACARLAASAPTAVTRPVIWRVVMGLAAVLLVAVVLRPIWLARSPMGRGRNVTAERSAPMTSRITTVFPADSVPIARSQLRFVWKGDAGASAYSLAITDANGKTVYVIDEISDTTFALPDTVRLTPSVVYFWHVDAPHADGSSAGSSSVSFRVAP
ncbi:MAG TPA: zf-HC2 domain-containing protein [Gemmatimonadaceae bacterium]|nr:zf-HC2 domain-containing protein [Gemmatimonadaceae bacterium]